MTSSIPSSAKINKDNQPLLEINNLIVEYPIKGGNVRAVDEISLALNKGEVLGLVGESGCGKSTLGFTILRLLKGGTVRAGEIVFNGSNLVEKPEEDMQQLRGPELSMIFQASQNALNPLQRVSNHFIDTLKNHGRWDDDAWNKVLEWKFQSHVSKTILSNFLEGCSNELLSP